MNSKSRPLMKANSTPYLRMPRRLQRNFGLLSQRNASTYLTPAFYFIFIVGTDLVFLKDGDVLTYNQFAAIFFGDKLDRTHIHFKALHMVLGAYKSSKKTNKQINK